MRILTNSDPETLDNLQRQQELMGFLQMRLFAMHNMKYFQQLYRGLSEVQDPINVPLATKTVSLKKFNGLKMILDPKM